MSDEQFENGPAPAPQPAGAIGDTDAGPVDLAALAALRGPGGRFAKGLPGPRLLTGRRAVTLMQRPEVAALVADKEARYLADAGGPENLSESKRDAFRELARQELGVVALGELAMRKDLSRAEGRRLWAEYRSAVADWAKLAKELGWERQAKPTQTLADWARERQRG